MDSIMNDINAFSERVANKQGNITTSGSNKNANLELFYKRLADLGYNLDELQPILECSDNMLILSGAGSGKTTALVLKLIRDMIVGDLNKVIVLPDGTQSVVQGRVLVSTFLKTGAEELSKAFDDWCQKLGIVAIDKSCLVFKTIHAEVYDALKAMGVKVEILEDSTKLIKGIMQALHIRSVMSRSRDITADDVSNMSCIASYARNRLDDKKYDNALMAELGVDKMTLDAFLEAFAKHRRATGKMDFEDMQELLLDGLQKYANVRDFISKRYDYVYVDEFQDTSQLQYELLKYYFNSAKRVIAIGDDDQCLVEGTKINIADGYKKVENITLSDRIKTLNGTSPIKNIIKKWHKGMCKHVYADDKDIVATDGHIVFAMAPKDTPAVLLIVKGYDEELIAVPDVDKYIDSIRNKEDIKVWVVGLYDSLELCNNLIEVLEDIGVNSYLAYFKFNRDFPYYTTHKNFNCDFVMYANGNYSALTLQVSKFDTSAISKLNDILNKYNRVYITDTDNFYKVCMESVNQSELYNFYLEVCKTLNQRFDVNKSVKSDNYLYRFVPVGNLVVGEYLKCTDGIRPALPILSIKDESYEGYVYDINLVHDHNYMADDFLVHNCIYSWRGSDIDIIKNKFEEDYQPTVKSLTVNYRCAQNILKPVISSIEQNSLRHPKDLKAFKEGGTVRVITKDNVNKLMQCINEDLKEGRSIGILGRTNNDLLVPAIILEIGSNGDGSLFNLSKGVSLQSRIARQIFGVLDLFTKRYTEEFENLFKMFLPRRFWYEAQSLASVLAMNKGTSLFTLPDKDLSYSVPTLYNSLLRGLITAYKQDPVVAYILVLNHMRDYVYTGRSAYAQKAKDLVDNVIALVTEHKEISQMNINQLDELFNETLVERFNKRKLSKLSTFIRLTTVHEAKGKEWDSVYIWNDYYGCFPNVVGGRDLTADEYEEERRVHYIAWTRAKKILTVMTNTSRLRGSFLAECDLSDDSVITDDTDSVDTSSVKLLYRGKTPKDAPDKTVSKVTDYESDVHQVFNIYSYSKLESTKITDRNVANVLLVTESNTLDDLWLEFKESLEDFNMPFDMLEDTICDFYHNKALEIMQDSI